MAGSSFVHCEQAAMRAFNLSEDIVAEIRHERYHHPHPRVQRNMEVLWLKSRGLTHADIAALADVSPRSVQRYLDEDAISPRIIRVSNHASINAESVCTCCGRGGCRADGADHAGAG